jgi:Double zinc ribbon/Adenylate and Guanylate cyclase catalytic domain
MICSVCQYANEEDALFCEQCGQALERRCPACGMAARPQARFCRKCGHSLTPPDVASPSAALPSLSLPDTRSLGDKLDRLQRYLPSHLSEKILASRGRLAGERKIVTVLFADIAGYTTLCEQLGEEVMFAVMDELYELCIHEVHRYEGTVNELTGDGVVAFFGAPLAVEQAPQRAVRAALALQRDGATTAYLPIVEILKQNFHIEAHDGEADIVRKVEAGLQRVGGDLESTAPYVLRLLLGDHASSTTAALPPEVVKRHTFEALQRLTVQGAVR